MPTAPSVPLPRRDNNGSVEQANSNRPPIWAVSSAAANGADAPLPVKCDRHSGRRDGVCCKELKGDDERSLVDPDVVRDV